MSDESRLFGISWRGVLAFMVIASVCGISAVGKKIEEPLYSLVLVVASAYFGSKVTPNGNGEKKKEEPKIG